MERRQQADQDERLVMAGPAYKRFAYPFPPLTVTASNLPGPSFSIRLDGDYRYQRTRRQGQLVARFQFQVGGQ
jgi:hypothetical protein